MPEKASESKLDSTMESKTDGKDINNSNMFSNSMSSSSSSTRNEINKTVPFIDLANSFESTPTASHPLNFPSPFPFTPSTKRSERSAKGPRNNQFDISTLNDAEMDPRYLKMFEQLYIVV